MAEKKTPEGMYFVVRSRRNNNLVLDVLGGEMEAGKVCCMAEYNGSVSQIWYEDQVTSTIRSKSSDLCLIIGSDKILMVDEYKDKAEGQEWVLAKDKIQDNNNPKIVVEISDANGEVDAQLTQGELKNEPHQLFDIDYQDAVYFYIVSELHGKVVTVKHAETRPDAKIVIEPKREGACEQLWHEGKHGFMRSKLNNFVLEAKENRNGASMRLMPFEPGNSKQLWCRHHGKILSLVHPKDILEIKKKKKDNGAKLVIGDDNNLPNQTWIFEEVSSE
uniref:Putative galactose-binding lectin n=1 Tax=Spirobranchus lamarcki TaxID=2082999 RepID=D2WL90_SPILA|nr:putative galactose-binding lectin [Spirobranchus lamarcki]